MKVFCLMLNLSFDYNLPQIFTRSESVISLSDKCYTETTEKSKLLMSKNLEQIEAAILSLPSNDFEKLRLWFFNLDYQRWDEQLERDIADGKLEALAQEAIAEFQAGHCREI